VFVSLKAERGVGEEEEEGDGVCDELGDELEGVLRGDGVSWAAERESRARARRRRSRIRGRAARRTITGV